ncbi:MAG: GAF domain-containing protein [Gammaproteobacteria bacterium]|nr:GAF domain-containing protein [Gammaproteobacteria bacterium]
MQTPEFPPDEAQRLVCLRSYDILDTEQEDVFDELAELAANICGAPIALVSLIDQSRQWFKAHIGLAKTETARSVAFCAHAILQPGLFQVPDTLQDERFADNPLVTGAPNIRFYAGAPLFTQDGYGLGTLCVIDQVPRELTEQQARALMVLRTHVLKLLELRRKTKELVEINRELDAFSYSVSHDLRAPLRAITGYSQVLMEDYLAGVSDEVSKLVQRIFEAARRMDQLTLDLINLARLSKVTLKFSSVDLGKLAQEVILELQKAEPDRQVDTQIEPNLQVLGDPGLLKIVVQNLFANAWKYTSECIHPRIEFGRREANGISEFFVRDNGVGFEMAYAGKLFQPFQRLHGNTKYPGTGIGLATVKRILQRHGATIRAESMINQGATFYFSLTAA